ncbi:hypothetical protein AXF42_Ash010616 [Apostasia shenzhenica]|uniref:Tyrosine-specific transport protein n=1 Tax=Apostasia shenzhenica TaxID=1088818 RepID=A0A2I0A6L1_9ASPA|nr:hypothetical protein AXF42_Ash010616 [Apostasia shenzhenica]
MLFSHHNLIKSSSIVRPCPFQTRRTFPKLASLRRQSSQIRPLLSPSNSSPHSSIRNAHDEPIHISPTTSSLEEQPEDPEPKTVHEKRVQSEVDGKSFWAAVSLIIGTAVGPGMLGLPSATIRAGPIPSTAAIILSWVYVMSSIILVAELSFAAMADDAVQEVSFTALASRSLGPNFGALVALVYASLSFSLLIACVSGIGSLLSQQFQSMNPIVAHALFPTFVGFVIGFFPFNAIDITNRLLCVLMLFSITALVSLGFSIGRTSLLRSLAFASWKPEAIMPAIPVTVLTLGFHVITPFVCKLLRNSIHSARKAILYGGFVPLAMVLSWNVVVLGLAGGGRIGFQDPIKLLLSVNAAALPAVQGFAFAALATSLIGYAVSFPKQLIDTVRLIAERLKMKEIMVNQNLTSIENQICRNNGSIKACSYRGEGIGQESLSCSVTLDDNQNSAYVTWIVLIVPIFIATYFQATFSKALDFAGVYANCFLFGILPPAMAWIQRSRSRLSTVLIELLWFCRSAALKMNCFQVVIGFLNSYFVLL